MIWTRKMKAFPQGGRMEWDIAQIAKMTYGKQRQHIDDVSDSTAN